MGEALAIVNQKGGVGKTTTTINIATSFCAVGKRVLVIDFDPQGNASTGFGIYQNERKNDIYDVMVDNANIKDTIYKTQIPNLNVIPSTVDLSAAELELSNLENREYILRSKLEAIQDEYDYIFIDCPPSLGLLTINALCASKGILIPLQCEFFALEGLSYLLNTVELVKSNLNSQLEIKGIVLTMHDKRNKLTEQVEEDVRNCLGDLVFKNVIPRNVRVSEAPSHGKPAIIYDLKCSGSIAYMKLAREILDLEKQEVEA